jgi:hypothetical protein
MEGRRDACLTGLLSSPPKGGFASIRFEHINVLNDLADDFAALKKQHHDWSEQHQDKKIVADAQESQQGCHVVSGFE